MENNTEESGDAPGIEIPQLATPSIYHDSMTVGYSISTAISMVHLPVLFYYDNFYK